LVTSSLYSEAKYGASEKDFWPAFTRCSRRQGRLLAWYMLLIGLEAWGAGYLAANYAKHRSNRLYGWLADKFLFSYISEWHPLLTPYVFVDKETTVQADILCTNNILYQGTVTQHFISDDGKLTGIFLTNPVRFNREPYVKDLEAWEKSEDKTKEKPDKEKYWQKIPSKNLYFFADKIFNMNLNFRAPAGQVAELRSNQETTRRNDWPGQPARRDHHAEEVTTRGEESQLSFRNGFQFFVGEPWPISWIFRGQTDHLFRGKPIKHSEACRSAIPRSRRSVIWGRRNDLMGTSESIGKSKRAGQPQGR
jgi:hypothetical protein